jgi:hypothetical protein
MTRHQRRKAARAAQAAKLERLANAERVRRVSEQVRDNLSNPKRPGRSSAGLVSGIYRGEAMARAHGRGVSPMDWTIVHSYPRGNWANAIDFK